MNGKKGQAALEYLVTYGWAILVVLVVLSSLYFLGVFNPKTTNTYSIKAPLLIQDMAVRDNGILFKISSNIADAASITDITINGQSCNSLGGFLYNPLFVNGNTYTGCYIDLGSYNKASGDINVRYSIIVIRISDLYPISLEIKKSLFQQVKFGQQNCYNFFISL